MLIKNKNDQDIEILLHDIHGEYTQCLHDLPMYAEGGGSETHVRCEIIWDTYEILWTVETLGFEDGESRVGEAFRLLFDDKLDDLIGDIDSTYTVWKITGTLKGVDRAFSALRDSLMPRLNDGGSITSPFWMPSGDDDVYDYWPNTMDMLWDFAQNLDEVRGGDSHKRAVWEIMDIMRKIARWDDLLPGGDNAFEWDATTRWGYEAS